MTKKSTIKEEREFEILRESIETNEKILKMYKDVIIEYGIDEYHVCNMPLHFEKHWGISLTNANDRIEEADISEKKKKELQYNLLFGEREETTKERLEETLKYLKAKINHAQHTIRSFHPRIKEKMVTDGINWYVSWSNMFDNADKVYKTLDKLKEQKKKRGKKSESGQKNKA